METQKSWNVTRASRAQWLPRGRQESISRGSQYLKCIAPDYLRFLLREWDRVCKDTGASSPTRER